MRRRSRPVMLVVLVLVVGLLAACVQPAAPVAQHTQDLMIVIPRGTAASQARGEASVTIPSRMELVAGQSVVIRNEDQAMHYFFFAPIAPGQTLRKTFSQPGQFGYSGFMSCSIAELQSVTVTVRPANTALPVR